MLSAPTDFRIHLLNRVEIQRILYASKEHKRIEKIIPSETKGLKELFSSYVTNSKNYQLEHIIPNKIEGDVDTDLLDDYENKKNTLGNHCIIHEKLNKKLNNKIYTKKQSIVEKEKNEEYMKKSVYEVGKITVAQRVSITDPYGMEIEENELFPDIEEIDKRTNEIIKALKSIIYK